MFSTLGIYTVNIYLFSYGVTTFTGGIFGSLSTYSRHSRYTFLSKVALDRARLKPENGSCSLSFSRR